MCRRLAALLTVLTAIALPSAGAPQEPPPAPRVRPRIGLALGGGSARGLAHVGVLAWLREHRVPVDAVAGTSIGGLIAGSYAIGMTDREIRALIEEMDWDAVLASDAPFEDKTFRRKEDRRALPASLQFGVRRGLYLPRSLNVGQRIALLFDRFTLRYSALPTFDDLPTPFRCVAFDVDRSESVVLDHGVLAEALRATMALPGIFPPVTIDGRLLVDGGFLDNVPVDAARQMAVDVVVAVDVAKGPASDRDVTAWSMVERAIDSVMARGTKRNLASADVVITPDTADLAGASVSFSKAAVLRERGYRAAEARASDLLRYAVTQAEYDAHEAARQGRRLTAPIVPDMLVVAGLEPGDRETLAKQIRARPGQPLNADRLAEDLLLLSGTDRYALLTCHLAVVQNQTQLVITATPRGNGPAFLTLGVELNNIDASNIAASLAGRTTVYDVAGRGSEVRLDFVVGTRQAAGVELFRPFLAPWLFAAPRGFVSHGTRNLFEDVREVAEYGLMRRGVGFDVGVLGGRVAEFRVGAELVDAEATVRVGGPLLPEAAGWDKSVAAQFTFDGQDSPVVPSRGTHAHVRLRQFFATSAVAGERAVVALVDNPQRFAQAEADAFSVFSLTAKNRLFTRFAAGTSFDAQPYINDFSLGGPFRMSAFRNDELRGAHYGLALAGYLRQLPRLPAWVGGHAYLAAWIETGSAFASRDTATWLTDVAAGVVIDSLVGPIFAGGGAARDGRYRLYVALGPLFR